MVRTYHLLHLHLAVLLAVASAQDANVMSRSGGDPLKPDYNVMKRPSRGGPADLITLGVRLRRVLDIDTIATTATVDLILSLEWKDSRLANIVPTSDPALRVTPDQIWTPGIILMNSAAETIGLYRGFHLYPDGTVKGLIKGLYVADVHIGERVFFNCFFFLDSNARICKWYLILPFFSFFFPMFNLDVSMFPFDRNRCEFIFDAPDYGSKEVSFAANAKFSTLDITEATVYDIEQWKVSRSLKLSPYDGKQNDYVVGMMDIHRIPSMIVVELILPLTLIVTFALLGLYTQSSDTSIAITTTAVSLRFLFLFLLN